MDLSIIIVHYNTPELLYRCLRSIVSSKPRCTYEIIVVDNGSHYHINYQIANIKKTSQGLKITLIKNEQNVGFGKANNQGVKKATGKHILFLNTDIEALENAITKLYGFIHDRKDDCIVGAKLLNVDLTDQPSCGPFYSLRTTFVMLFARGDRLRITRYSPPVGRIVDWVSGACFIMRRRDFMSLNGFDEHMFMYMEEVELMYRARQSGMTVVFYPGARFVHLGATTTKKSENIILSPVVNIFQGLLYVYHRHRSARERRLLCLMLLTKARLSVIIGRLMKNTRMIETYRRAEQIVLKERV